MSLVWGHPSKTSGQTGGCVNQRGRHRRRCRAKTGCPQTQICFLANSHKHKFVCVPESVSESESLRPPPPQFLSLLNVYAQYNPDVRERGVGGCLPNGRCWPRRVGRSKMSLFGWTSLMNYPLVRLLIIFGLIW